MAMYGIAILPLIQGVQSGKIVQKRYADDGSAAGKLEELKQFLDLRTYREGVWLSCQ